MISVLNNKSELIGDDSMLLFSHMHPAEAQAYEQMEKTSRQAASPEDKKSKKQRRRSKKSNACTSVDGMDDAGFKKRKLTEEQVRLLELNFGNEHKLESERKDRLAAELGLDPRQVAVWFQNRRARWKIKKLEEEYSKLKAAHDSLVLCNCQLESQVMKLEERLATKENEVRRLSSEGTSSDSPVSCLSMEQTMDDVAPLLPLELGFGIMEEGLLGNVFCNYNMPNQTSGNYVIPGPMEWSNMYYYM